MKRPPDGFFKCYSLHTVHFYGGICYGKFERSDIDSKVEKVWQVLTNTATGRSGSRIDSIANVARFKRQHIWWVDDGRTGNGEFWKSCHKNLSSDPDGKG